MGGKFFEGVNKREAISWSLYDFANSAYFLIILSYVFPIFFKEVIAGGMDGDFWWGFAISISVLIGGFATPVIGAIADYDTRRKQKFVLFALLSIVGCAALYFTGAGLLIFSLILFICMNIFFEISKTVYDSFLINVSTDKTAGRISGFGWGLGYLGSVVAMILFRPLYGGGYAGTMEPLYKLTFPLTALFFLLFSLPAFLFMKDQKEDRKKESIFRIIGIGFRNVFSTIGEIRKHKKIAWFLLGFYLLNDGLVTLFAFISIYAKTTLGMDIMEIGIILLVVQLIAFPSAIFLGWLSDKTNSRTVLLITILVWIVFIIGTSLSFSKMMFSVMAVIAGLVIGGSQAIARSWFSKMIPFEKRCEFFGFNGFASKVSATTGPLLFGGVSALTGNQRIAMLTLIPYFIFAFIIFYRIGGMQGPGEEKTG